MNITAQRIYDYIVTHIDQYGYGPTIREISDHVDTSPSNAHRHVEKLARAGKIIRRRHVARSIRLPAGEKDADLPGWKKDADLPGWKKDAGDVSRETRGS